MKYILLLLVLCSHAFSVCLDTETAEALGCQRLGSVEALNWCSERHGQYSFPFKTSETCSLAASEKYKNGYFSDDLFSVNPSWNKKFKKSVEFKCSGELAYLCEWICYGEKSCLVEEGVCKDCAGTTIDIMNLFKNVGKTIVSTKKVNGTRLADMVSKKEFVTFSSKSIYNIITSFNSRGVKRQFKSLCPDNTEYPVIFAKVYPKTRELISFSYVACESSVYELSSISN